MQVGVMFIFLALWLLIWWLGSIAFEKTGMERSKARFQALSAFSGTGFTTQEAESVVNHPQRRKIAGYLIFLGNAGIIAFLILLVLYIRAGLVWPSLLLSGIIVAVVLALMFAVRLGLVDKMTNAILALVRRRDTLFTPLIIHQEGGYAVVRLQVPEGSSISGRRVKDIGFVKHDIVILALKRGKKVISLPSMNERLQPEDHLLCYGKPSAMKVFIK